MKTWLIILFSSLLTPTAFAQTDQAKGDGETEKAAFNQPAMCKNAENAIIKKTSPSEKPNYFFRTFNKDGKEYVSYAGANANILLNLDTAEEHKFVGKHNIDPVPVGSNLISVPYPMHFIKTTDIEKGNEAPTSLPVKNDYLFMGVYQSVGKLQTQNGKTQYRILTDESGATIADYEISGEEITMLNTPRAICRDKFFKLPMLSKDGKKVSGFDVETQTTKIWEINNNGTCTEIANLGIGTGKADFNYDGTQITFHTTNQEQATDYFSSGDTVPGAMNVFVYNMAKKNIKQITHNDFGQNSYYPVFKEDNTIIFGEISGEGKPTFVQANPSLIKGEDFNHKEITNTGSMQIGLIGQVWSKFCTNGYASMRSGAAMMLSMPPDKCEEFIKKHWQEHSIEMKESYESEGYETGKLWNEKSLYAACSRNWKELPESKDLSFDTLPKGGQIMVTKCGICHKQLTPSYLQQIKFPRAIIENIEKRIYSTGPDKMPKSGSLTDEEKAEIIKYMNLRKKSE